MQRPCWERIGNARAAAASSLTERDSRRVWCALVEWVGPGTLNGAYSMTTKNGTRRVLSVSRGAMAVTSVRGARSAADD